MAADEVLAWVKVPKATPQEFSRVYKISKRFEDDISAVCLALNISVHAGTAGAWLPPLALAAWQPPRCARSKPRPHSKAKSGATTAPPPHARVLQAEFQPISDHACQRALPHRGAGQFAAALLAGKPGPAAHATRRLGRGGPGMSDHPTPGTVQRHLGIARKRPRAGSRCSDLHRRHARGARHRCMRHPSCRPWRTARLRGVDARAALAMPGVVDVILAADIPGDPMLAAFAGDEPGVCHRHGAIHRPGCRPGAGATPRMQARHAARKVVLDIAPLPAILTVDRCTGRQSYVLPPVFVRTAVTPQWRSRPAHTLQGTLEVGGQEHFYLEGQVAYVLPQEQNQWLRHSSTQHPGEVQHWVAHALGIDNHAVRGGMPPHGRRLRRQRDPGRPPGGVRQRWPLPSCTSPVKLRLDRDDDFMVTGKRHPFAYTYTAGFDDTGRLSALQLDDGRRTAASAPTCPGRSPTAPSSTATTPTTWSMWTLPRTAARRNTQSHTAFRGFGGPQGVILIEAVMGDIARHLNMDPLAVRKRNLYSDEAIAGTGHKRDTTHYQMKVEDNILAPLLARLEASCAVPSAAPRDCALERQQPRGQAWHRHHPGEVRHQLHRHAVQPGWRAGACVHRRQRAGEPRRHRNGPGPAHQGGADRGRRTGHRVRAGAGYRQRHQQGGQRIGHRRVRRHRPQRPRRPVCRAPCARQPGSLCRAGSTAAAPAPSASKAGR